MTRVQRLFELMIESGQLENKLRRVIWAMPATIMAESPDMAYYDRLRDALARARLRSARREFAYENRYEVSHVI